MIEVKFNCSSTFELMSEMNALLVGMKVANKEIDNAPARLAAVAEVAGIPAQPVKKGPGRPPKNEKPAVATPAVEKPTAPPVKEDPVEADAVETTFEDYKTFMTGAFTGGHRGIVLEVLAEYGAQKISQVDAGKYDEVMAQVQTRIDAAAMA